MRKLDSEELLFDNTTFNIFQKFEDLGKLSNYSLWFRRVAICLLPLTIMFKILHTFMVVIIGLTIFITLLIITFLYNVTYDVREYVKDLWVDKQS
jgi:hypothetical protein